MMQERAGIDAQEHRDRYINNFEHTLANIISAANMLKKNAEFTKAFKMICAGSHPTAWTPNDGFRIMQSYQLIFNIIKKSDKHLVPGWKIPGYSAAAMWFYDTETDYRFTSVEYHLAACDVCLHHPIHKIGQTNPDDIQHDPLLSRYVENADKATEICAHIETSLYHTPNEPHVVAAQQKQLAQHYQDISLTYQAAGDYEKALYYYESALRTLQCIPEQDKSVIQAHYQIYRELSLTFKFNPFYHDLFSLMKDFFHGDAKATFSHLAQLDFNCRYQPGYHSENENVFAQCLAVIDRYVGSAHLPSSSLKKQLQSDYFYGRFNAFMQSRNMQSLQTTNEESLSTSPIVALRRNSFFEEQAPLQASGLDTTDEKLSADNDSESDPDLFIPSQNF